MTGRHVPQLATMIVAISASASVADAATELVFADGFDGYHSYRIVSLTLQDPHFWVGAIGCYDVTSALNSSEQSALQGDSDQDGFLDAGYVLRLLPLDQSDGASQEADLVVNPACYAPTSSGVCVAGGSTAYSTIYTSQTTGTCLAPVSGTTNTGYGTIDTPSAPCFATAATSLTVDFGGAPLTLHDARVGATYDGAPATNLINGLVFGFVSEADADATILPASIPLVGGSPLSSVLAGGTGACPAFSDKDTDNAVSGWWFYFDFTATSVDYVP